MIPFNLIIAESQQAPNVNWSLYKNSLPASRFSLPAIYSGGQPI